MELSLRKKDCIRFEKKIYRETTVAINFYPDKGDAFDQYALALERLSNLSDRKVFKDIAKTESLLNLIEYHYAARSALFDKYVMKYASREDVMFFRLRISREKPRISL